MSLKNLKEKGGSDRNPILAQQKKKQKNLIFDHTPLFLLENTKRDDGVILQPLFFLLERRHNFNEQQTVKSGRSGKRRAVAKGAV